MKTSAVVILAFLACAGCDHSQESDAPIVITTPAGRTEVATKRYTTAEIENAIATGKEVANPLDVPHPVYPTREQFDILKQHLQGGGDLWYFKGLDSGWAVVKNREVLWVLVTSHEY